ncbi:unnamed protein product [Schistosoma intercalatum]|nr:unnamed protein product [Schistosoma intercalatum]
MIFEKLQNIEQLNSLNVELLNSLNIGPLNLLNIEQLNSLNITLFNLILFMFCIKFKINHQTLSSNEIDKNEKLNFKKKFKKLLHHNKFLRYTIEEDQFRDEHLIEIDSNSKCIKSNESIANHNHSILSQQLTLLHHNQLSNSLNNNNNSLPIKLSNNLDLNQSNEKHHHHSHYHYRQQQPSFPFTVWFIKVAKKFLHWKNTFIHINLLKQSNYSHIINDNPIEDYQNTIHLNRIENDNLNKITIQKRLNDKETFGLNIQHIKQKANSLKEQGRKAKVYHGYPIWTDTKSVIQQFSNRISSNSTTHYHLSPYRQCDSQSDLFDPIYSAIQYPLKDTLQSTHSSLWDHSSVSVHQPYAKDRLLVRNIWTSQDSVVSDAHVYCELIELKSNKTHYQTNKKSDSRPFYKDYSSCSLRSYENQCFQDVISDKCSNEQPPKLPHRNYGESTLNMVANLRLWATRNKQKFLKNLHKINKLHKHVYSMSDMTWRLNKKRNIYDLPLYKTKNYTEQSSLRTSYR